MKKILLSIDLDGTLLNDDAQVSLFSHKTLTEFVKKNKENIILLNSGRPICQMKKFLLHIMEGVGEDLKSQYYACSDNGCWMLDHKLNTIYRDIMSTEEIKYLWSEAVKLDLNPFAHFDNATYYAKLTENVKYIVDRHSAIPGNNNMYHAEMKSLESFGDIEVPKFTLLEEKEANKKIALDFVKSHSNRMNSTYTTAETIFYMIMASNKTKATPINYLVDSKNIDRDNIYVFADSDNDIPAFPTTNNVVVPNSSAQEIIDQGTIICDANDNDGVAKFIQKNLV